MNDRIRSTRPNSSRLHVVLYEHFLGLALWDKPLAVKQMTKNIDTKTFKNNLVMWSLLMVENGNSCHAFLIFINIPEYHLILA